MIRLLLVAEAPPNSNERYFYFEDVSEQDSLFRYVCKGLFGASPDRSSKPQWLQRLKDEGVFLIDLMEDPIGSRRHSEFVAELIVRCHELAPEKIVLLKAPVFDAAYLPLRRAGLPVSSVRIPFPGSGQQRNFELVFAIALENKADANKQIERHEVIDIFSHPEDQPGEAPDGNQTPDKEQDNAKCWCGKGPVVGHTVRDSLPYCARSECHLGAMYSEVT